MSPSRYAPIDTTLSTFNLLIFPIITAMVKLLIYSAKYTYIEPDAATALINLHFCPLKTIRFLAKLGMTSPLGV